jgi:hypothetical protein
MSVASVGVILCWMSRREKYEGSLHSSWTHLITPSRNFVEVRWRSFFFFFFSFEVSPLASAALLTTLQMFWWGSTDPFFPRRTQNSIQILAHAISGLFQPWKRSSETRNFEVINGLQHVFEKWAERCKSASLAKGGISKKRPSPHLHNVPTRRNKVSPRTLPTALVLISSGGGGGRDIATEPLFMLTLVLPNNFIMSFYKKRTLLYTQSWPFQFWLNIFLIAKVAGRRCRHKASNFIKKEQSVSPDDRSSNVASHRLQPYNICYTTLC